MTAPKKRARVVDDVPAVADTASVETSRGDAVVYTNRLGAGPWPGVIEALHIGDDERGALAWLRVTKPNGTEFFVTAPCGTGPDTFALV